MNRPSSRIRTNGAYVIKSAESRPRAVKATRVSTKHSRTVIPGDKKLAQAVRKRRDS